jgi:hypothetical protein
MTPVSFVGVSTSDSKVRAFSIAQEEVPEIVKTFQFRYAVAYLS